MSDEARLRASGAEIERLLEHLGGLVTAPVLHRIERVLRCIIELYAAGLARSLHAARAAGASEPRLCDLVCDDELLASLLVLHGLHPLGTEERVRRALATVRAELEIAEEALELVGIEDGVVKLRAKASIGGGAMAQRVAEGAIRRVIEAAAPEVTSTRIDGLEPPASRDPGLVQLRVGRRAT